MINVSYFVCTSAAPRLESGKTARPANRDQFAEAAFLHAACYSARCVQARKPHAASQQTDGIMCARLMGSTRNGTVVGKRCRIATSKSFSCPTR